MTADEQYAANLALFTAKNPQMGTQLQGFPVVGVQMHPGPHGHLVGTVWDNAHGGWVPLCAADPLAEAERDAEALYHVNTRTFVLLGMGLGYFAAAIAKRLLPYQRLAIFEAAPSLYKAAMYAIDMQVFNQPGKRIDVFVGDGILASGEHWWMSLDVADKLAIAPPLRSGYTRIHEAARYDALTAQAENMMRYHLIGLATWQQHGPSIGRNDLQNLPETIMSPGIAHLTDCWKDRPAFCIAAGPSLHKNLAQLMDAEVQRHCALLAVGGMYATLRQLGVIPDIVSAIDFQRLTWTDQFHHVPLDQAPALVYLHSTYPQTVRRWPGPRFVALNSSDTVAWAQQFFEDKGDASRCQTVAHLNLLTALRMGANPIILLGQDLSQPKSRHHALGARAQDKNVEESPEQHVEMADCYGQSVWTRHSYLSMKTVFEQIIAEHPGRIVNCTEGGLPLAGAPNVPLTQVVQSLRQGWQSDARPRCRDVLAERWHAHQPQAQWENLGSAMHIAHEQVATLIAWAHETQALAMQERTLLAQADRQPDDDQRVDALRAQIAQRYDSLRQVLPGYGLFAVRRFAMVQRVCDIPPAEHSSTQVERTAWHARRTIAMAEDILAIADDVALDVRQTERRLADVIAYYANKHSPLPLLLARQSYGVAWRTLAAQKSEAISAHNLLPLLYHTQQYGAIQSLAQHLPALAMTRKAQRSVHRLTAAEDPSVTLAYARQAAQPLPQPVEVGSGGDAEANI